jgi:hypothetical protein
MNEVDRSGLALAFFLAGLLFFGVFVGYHLRGSDVCPEPQYDVNRVVKMHEENRKCEVELEEARDNVLVCGRLLKRALE